MNMNSYLDVFMNAFPFTSYRSNNALRLISILSLTFSLAFWRWSHYCVQSVHLNKILKVKIKQWIVTVQTIEIPRFMHKNLKLSMLHNTHEERKHISDAIINA